MHSQTRKASLMLYYWFPIQSLVSGFYAKFSVCLLYATYIYIDLYENKP